MSITTSIDPQIATWRAAVLSHKSVSNADADELEGHLREQIGDLIDTGLSADEAFLIAVKRLGEVNALTAEYAREHGERVWKQLIITSAEPAQRRPFVTMLIFSAIAIAAIQTARLVAGGAEADWVLRNIGFFVLVPLAAYFAVVNRISPRRAVVLSAIVVALGVAINVFPFAANADTATLAAIHLPFLLWFVVAGVYVPALGSTQGRMDFVRFLGEWAIYYVLIAIGGIVLMSLTFIVFGLILPTTALDEVYLWVLPSGMVAAVIVAAWLVEVKKSIVENLAPVLTAIFTPLFAAMLAVAAIGYVVLGISNDFDRTLLTAFDVLLLVVVALVVYGISARDSASGAGPMDVIRLVAVCAAIVLDILVLVSLLGRVGELGFTANRVAALGLNVILLVNLIGTVWHSARLVAGRGRSANLETWQTSFLPILGGWLLFVVLVVPPLFSFA
jgi:hypothetical protein